MRSLARGTRAGICVDLDRGCAGECSGEVEAVLRSQNVRVVPSLQRYLDPGLGETLGLEIVHSECEER